MKRMKKIFATLLLAGSLIFIPGVNVVALADSASSQDACAGIGVTGASCSGSGATTSISNLLTTIVNVISVVVGIVAVIMIIVGGLKFVSSGGDTNKVSSAKGTITYALVGLVVAALAQFLVHFVLGSV